MGAFGNVIGLPFTLEGVSFFTAFALAGLLVIPSLIWLYRLTQPHH